VAVGTAVGMGRCGSTKDRFAGLGVRATTAVQIELNCSHGELAHPSVRD